MGLGFGTGPRLGTLTAGCKTGFLGRRVACGVYVNLTRGPTDWLFAGDALFVISCLLAACRRSLMGACYGEVCLQ